MISAENRFQQNPAFADTDGDGLINGDEIEHYYTDPLIPDATADTDNDGLTNVEEVDAFSASHNAIDTDKDEL